MMVTVERSEFGVNTPAPHDKAAWEVAPEAFPLRLKLPSEWELTDERLVELWSLNEEWQFEADCDGGLWIVAPPGTESGAREASVVADIVVWSRRSGRGQAIGSAMVLLPNGWRRAPDAAWISDERLAEIADADRIVWSVCPDFVVEVRSVTDQLDDLQTKMEMWMSQGSRLGWLVDPQEEAVWVYRPEQEAERVERPESLTAAEIADDLMIDFSQIWPQRDQASATS